MLDILILAGFFADQKNTDQKYRKTVYTHYMTTYFLDDSCFRVTMTLLIAQLYNADFLKASSGKVQDIMHI